jgi:hypothetical protein
MMQFSESTLAVFRELLFAFQPPSVSHPQFAEITQRLLQAKAELDEAHPSE